MSSGNICDPGYEKAELRDLYMKNLVLQCLLFFIYAFHHF